MKDETKNKISAQVAKNHFGKNLPVELEGFTLKKIFAEDDDKFIFFSYESEELHCAVTTYFHEETMEFKVRQRIGLTEFCLTKFFTEDFDKFQRRIDSDLADVIKNLRGIRDSKFNRFLSDKKLDGWAYGKNLPATLEGFELFINPAAPVEVTNGSFIVINYVNFAISSEFVLYYNVYTDEFSGERKIRNAPQVTYKFDAKTLKVLEETLKKNLTEELREIRRLSQ